jgi:hypothetical protein
MPYVTREDGERFVIPSYRDTLSAKKTSLLKKEIKLLSSNYGEYITLQRKTTSTYEIAFSPESGYLLGECVWNYFKRPYDMIYCEAIPNTTDAILVIVKSGTVYLDGSFPVDSIPEELVIFKTQNTSFSIFISGDVPISHQQEDGKFSFDESSIRSFDVLEQPVFPTLPTVKAFQLQLVDVVLKNYGIGVLPVKNLVIALVAIGLAYMGYSYLTAHKEISTSFTMVAAVNPYQGYIDELTSPDPSKEIHELSNVVELLYSVPGWLPTSLVYDPGFPAHATVTMESTGGRLQILNDWVDRNNASLNITPSGAFVTIIVPTSKRSEPTTITHMQSLFIALTDRLSYLLPPDSLHIGNMTQKKSYTEAIINVDAAKVTPIVLDMLGQYIQGLPLVLNKFTLRLTDGQLTGTITFTALGN